MARTEKISIAVDKEHIRRARAAAKSEGVSLSRYIARALEKQLEDQARQDAARDLYRDWGPETVPTAADRKRFANMMRRRKRNNTAA